MVIIRLVLITLAILFSGSVDGQKASAIQVLREKLLLDLQVENSCALEDVKQVASFYNKRKKKDNLNGFYTILFSHDPQKLDFNFLQGLVHQSISLSEGFNVDNMESLKEFYKALRLRLSEMTTNHQALLLEIARKNLGNGNVEIAYNNLTEVMRIYDSRLEGNNYLFSTKHYPFEVNHKSKDLAFKAYILFLESLPVDEVRFKMLAKNSRFNSYLQSHNRYAYEVINNKLAQAGYQKMEVPPIFYEPTKPLSEEEIKTLEEEKRKREEEYKKKYDWIKKE